MTDIDLMKCAKLMRSGDLSFLASAFNVTDEELKTLQEQYKNPQGLALQLLRKWRAGTHGTRQQLHDILTAAEYCEAAEL